MTYSNVWRWYKLTLVGIMLVYSQVALEPQMAYAFITIATALAIPFAILIMLIDLKTTSNVNKKSIFGTGFRVMYKRLSAIDQQILNQNNPYYSQLNEKNKKEFEYRIVLFLENKKFVAKRFSTVTNEMKILIASSAVQLSFGFTAITLKHFQKIFIYPQAYKSSYSGEMHRGEVNSAGAIVFSWEDFMIGYRNATDGYNVGLHEMAHALYLEDVIKNGEDDFLNAKELRNFQATGKLEIAKIRNNEDSFIRDYAATNRDEFFAVCIEQFFEQPEEFQLQLPLLFKNLQLLLNQNPINKENPVGNG